MRERKRERDRERLGEKERASLRQRDTLRGDRRQRRDALVLSGPLELLGGRRGPSDWRLSFLTVLRVGCAEGNGDTDPQSDSDSR